LADSAFELDNIAIARKASRRTSRSINIFVYEKTASRSACDPPAPPAARFIDKATPGAYLRRARMQERLACFLGCAGARAFRALGFSVNGKTRERLAIPSPLAKLLGGRSRLAIRRRRKAERANDDRFSSQGDVRHDQ
jgi:hypothetical protein